MALHAHYNLLNIEISFFVRLHGIFWQRTNQFTYFLLNLWILHGVPWEKEKNPSALRLKSANQNQDASVHFNIYFYTN